MMNNRERILATLLFQTPDRVPFDPGWPREKTLKRWHSEGLGAEFVFSGSGTFGTGAAATGGLYKDDSTRREFPDESGVRGKGA